MTATLNPVDAISTPGNTFKDPMGLTGRDLEVLYGLGYAMYNQNRFKDAEEIFGALCLNDHLSERFWKGLGASRQMLKAYEGAIAAYSMASAVGSKDPMIPVHAAECHLALSRYDEVLDGLENALAWARGSDRLSRVLDRADTLLTALDRVNAGERE